MCAPVLDCENTHTYTHVPWDTHSHLECTNDHFKLKLLRTEIEARQNIGRN